MKFYFAIIFLVLGLKNSLAQNDSIKKIKIDSLTRKFMADSARIYRFNKFRPYANVDNRNSFIRNKPVNLNGGQVGIIFKEYHVFGFGYYTMTQESQRPRRTNEDSRTINQYLTLNYATFFYQYVLVDKRFFEIDLPFEIGYGKYNLKSVDASTNQVLRNSSSSIVPVGAGVQLVLKPVRWIGFSTTGGYRYVGENNTRLNFNGWYYSFGLWLDVRQVYRDIKFYFYTRKDYRKAVSEIREN